jgi:hypothetical protein
LYEDTDIDVDLWNIGDCEEVMESTKASLVKRKEQLLKEFNEEGLTIPMVRYEALVRRALRSNSRREDIIPVYFDLSFYYNKENLNGISGPLQKGFELESVMNLVGFKLLEKFTVSARLVDGVDLRKEVRATVVWVCLTSLGLDFIRACHQPRRQRQRS